MRKTKKKVNLLIPLIIIIAYIIVPVTAIQLNGSDPYAPKNTNISNLEPSLSSLIKNSNSDNNYLDGYLGKKNSKFNSYLNEFLVNYTVAKNDFPIEIKVIIYFRNSISKEERVKILNSVFDDYDLITNYDIIPGVYIKIDPKHLIDKENVIEKNIAITRVYKSKVYQYPYIQENDLRISALNEDYYPNWWLPAIGAENLPYNGSGVKVAVIDTGIYNHPDLTITNNRNFVTDEPASNYNDNVGHGTHVAGIIAGNGGGSSGKYRGVAPGVLLINARAGNSSGLSEVDIINAIEWSSKPINEGGAGADIISMSFGGGYPFTSDPITDAISNAQRDYGVIFVASAGNSGPDYFTGSTPAAGVDVIAVGATDKDDELASFSSWGPTFNYVQYPDVVAPGVYIISTEALDSVISDEERYRGDYFDFAGNADYIPLSGTSMSCPMVSGALAILLEAFPNITPETARIALIEGARRLVSENDNGILKSGAGIINITASLNYLESISPDYNNVAKLYPDYLPFKPYDLLNFPGDHQKFNLTIISGDPNTLNIEIPNYIQGVSLSLNKSTIIFSESGINYDEIDIQIEKDAFAGVRNFQINLTVGGQVYDTLEISLDIRLPEAKVLMESFHGLNDWFPYPFYSFAQIGFYEAMKDLANLNISIDYNMEHWTPDYNKNLNNSILTEDRLAQYDLVVLQSPILPYSPTEIESIEKYFDNGGNLLFLGTRYQDMAIDNTNYLFSRLGVDIQINTENVMNDKWIGLGISLDSQSVHEFGNSKIFKNVTKFYWQYGNSFAVSTNAESIATINGTSVAAMYNGTAYSKGNLLAFGDLHWLFNNYKSSTYYNNHLLLLKNVIDFLIPKEEVSINIDLSKDSTLNSGIDLSVYLKNQTSESPISDSEYTSLDVTISNISFSKQIILNTTLSNNGIYFNTSYNLPSTSYVPYNINVNLTIGSKNFVKSTKLLFYNQNKIPKINYLTSDLPSNDPSVTRAIGDSTDLIAKLDKSTYGNFKGYLSIYSYSFYNTKETVNKTLTFTYTAQDDDYRNNFNPVSTDPSGYAIYYIIPSNSNYTNPNSPRYAFQIVNNDPEILKTTSIFNYNGHSDITFENTETSDGKSYVYSANQGNTFNFEVYVEDIEESNNSNLRVFVNLLICSVTSDGYVSIIYPKIFELNELNYQSLLNNFEGSLTIPDTMQYSSITGTKSISTVTGSGFSLNREYLGILLITVYDNEGGSNDFIIILNISERPIDFTLIIIIVISIIALIGVTSAIIYYARRKKHPRITPYQPSYQDYYPPSYEKPEDQSYITPEPLSHLGQFYCPFCGKLIGQPKKFCPHCGESLTFDQEDG